MTSQLPDRPNLEQLKKQAKALAQAARGGDPAALVRIRAQLPHAISGANASASARDSDSGDSSGAAGVARLALHDAQAVIAREYGFRSWNALREHVEERSLSFEQAVEAFIRHATGDAPARAERLLALHPAIAHASLWTELVLGDASAVKARLAGRKQIATQSGGPQQWEPLLYVCHTSLHRGDEARAAGLVATARALLAAGADPNAEYHWNWHPELPRTALWGAICAMGHLPLAQALLEAGANPTDGVSAHIAAGSGHIESLELLRRYGLKVDGVAGGVPPLRHVLTWADKRIGIEWLLTHGADANLAWGEPLETPLHVAARRWDVAMVELLVQHGGDIHARRSDGRTAHTIAELQGNHAIGEWLLAHGAHDQLTPLERFVAACARGDRAPAETMLASTPGLRTQLTREHHLMMAVPAERGDTAVLSTMLACGFDPNVGDADKVTALHRAAMAGRPEAVQVLIAGGASVQALDGMFAGSPLLWAAEGWSNHDRHDSYVHAARHLIDAGAPLTWTAPEGTPDPEHAEEMLAELVRAAEQRPSGEVTA